MEVIRERNSMSPELAEALRKEIRTTLEADGEPFDSNIARRVYDLSTAAFDMCEAATDTERPDGFMRRYIPKDDQERTTVSPQLAEALRNEIRAALEADGKPFDINVARRVYDLAIAARDMCIAATGTVKEAIDQIKDTNGPLETLDASDTPESQIQASESFGARLLRELMATLPLLQGRPSGDDPKQLVHALAEARRNGMHDVAEELEVKLFGKVLLGPRPIADAEVDVIEGSFEHGFADGRAGALPESEEGPYHEGYLKGTTEKYLDKGTSTGDHSAVIARDIRLGRTSESIRDEIIAEVGMMAYSRTPEMQARYDAAVERERANGVLPAPCDHPTEAQFEAPYDDGYQVFCRTCGKSVRLGRLGRRFVDDGTGSHPYDDTELRGCPSNRVPMDPIEREELEGK